MVKVTKPLIGITLDWEKEGSFSTRPHYALRTHYFDAVERAGGLVRKGVGDGHELGIALGLHDLISILKSLKEAAAVETPILALLKGPVSRCAQVSHEFEAAMKTFDTKSKSSLKDWTKMEFMRGDINEFIDTLADYKATITIGLGTINM